MSDTPEEMVSNDAAPAQVDEQVDGSTEPAAELLEVPEIEEPSTIDALVVAHAVDSGGARILTGDREDLIRLAASHPEVSIELL